MRSRVFLGKNGVLLGAAALGVAGLAQAQVVEPENLLPDEAPAAPAPQAAPTTDNGFEQAFSQGEVVQKILPDVQSWTSDGVTALIATVEGIADEGLRVEDYRLSDLRGLALAGPSPELDALASQIFVWLVEDMRDGRTPMDGRKQWFVFDPDADRYPSARLLQQAAATGDVAGTLAKVRPEHPDYERLKAKLATTTAPATRNLIIANMDRWRWLPRDLGQQYLMTNVPEYQLRLTVNDQIISTYRTIVGKPGRTATPQLAEVVEGIVFNPTWTVPQSIVKGEGLGARVLNNPSWAKRAGYKATKGANGWVTVVQQPGPGNSLGRMKLDMPNKHAIFLHDTPSRGLFRNTNRALSHGCIRTERARELAITMAIIGSNATNDEERQAAAAKAVAISTSGKYTRVPIEKRMPVYITYFTMAQDIEGEMTTFKDIYGRDAAVIASFGDARKANRSRVTGEQVIPIEDDPRA